MNLKNRQISDFQTNGKKEIFPTGLKNGIWGKNEETKTFPFLRFSKFINKLE